jgi:peptide deformylase
MIHKIDKTNQILFDEMLKFDFSNPPINPDELAKQLAESLIETTGVGLSANQIGLPYRAFALKSNPIYVMFNPIIVHSSEDEEYMEEGCLSFPNLIINIKRPKKIRVRFTQPNGKTTTEAFEGLTARVIQHEVDHLNGITFKQRATKYHLDKGLRKMKKRVYNKNIM